MPVQKALISQSSIIVQSVSLPQLIVDGSSGRRKVLMVKFLTPIYVYFYCFEIMDKNLSLNPTLCTATKVCKEVKPIQLLYLHPKEKKGPVLVCREKQM